MKERLGRKDSKLTRERYDAWVLALMHYIMTLMPPAYSKRRMVLDHLHKVVEEEASARRRRRRA